MVETLYKPDMKKYKRILLMYTDTHKEYAKLNRQETCQVCELMEGKRHENAVLSLYYDSKPSSTVYLLDAAVNTIISLEDTYTVEHLIKQITPFHITYHYFMAGCFVKEKKVVDFDVFQISYKIMESYIECRTKELLTRYKNLDTYKTCTTNYACNTFKKTYVNRERDSQKIEYISDMIRGKSETSYNNDTIRLQPVFDFVYGRVITSGTGGKDC